MDFPTVRADSQKLVVSQADPNRFHLAVAVLLVDFT